MVTVTVKLFGPLSDRLSGQHEVVVGLDDEPTCGAIYERLEKECPELAPIRPSCRLAVNHEFAADDCRVNETDEIALIGMVSGG